MARRVALALLVSLAGTISAVMAIQPQTISPSSTAAIRLRAGTFSPGRGDAPPMAGDALLAAARVGEPAEYLVQFQGPVLEEWKAAVSAAGATLLEYLPDFTFRVRMRPQDAARVRQLPFVAWVGPFHPDYKVPVQHPAAEERPLIIRLDRDADVDAVNAAASASGVRVARRGRALLMVIARGDQARALARIPGVAGIEPFALRIKHNEFGGGLILGSRLANDSGYDGSSQVVAVADTGLGTGTASGAHAGIPAARVRSIVNRPGVPDFCFETIADDGAADVDTGHGTHVAT